MKRIISFITVLSIVVSLLGCNVQQINQQQNYINENIITDTIIQETFITEKAVSEIVLEENVIEETYLFEHFITEDIIAESLIFEVTVGEDTADILLSQLPNGIEQYNIDIDELLTKFAIGTTIVIVAGVVTGVGLSTPAYYLFASVATTTIKEAIIGAVIGAVSNSIVPYINNDKTINDEVKKYAIEGAVDGYMWGAISGFAMSLITGFSYSTPSLLSDEDNELSRLIEQYESVMYFDEKPNYHARKVDDVSYLINEKGEVVNCYDDLGNTIPTPNKSEINRITTIQKNGRYSSKFGVKNGIVYSNNQEIGRLNEALEIVGTGKYEGQLIGTIGKNISNKKAILIENNWRAIQSDIRFDSSGKIVNSMSKHFNEGTVDTLTKKFNIKIINDIYSKENGKKIAYIIEKDGKKFLMNNSENKILG